MKLGTLIVICVFQVASTILIIISMRITTILLKIMLSRKEDKADFTMPSGDKWKGIGPIISVKKFIIDPAKE